MLDLPGSRVNPENLSRLIDLVEIQRAIAGDIDGERAVGQPSIWTPDNLDRRPFEINYKKGPLALVRLEEPIGEETFDRLLVRYMTDPIDSTPDLLDALESEAGPAPLFQPTSRRIR